MLILGVESSCDETAFAVVENGTRALSNAIASQVELHARFGGVVPEIASRAHLECLVPLLHAALDEAGTTLDAIDAIAVTQGPGLAGCLLVGLEFAKALAFRHGKPLIPVHHIAGHVYSVHIGRERDAWGEGTGSPPPDPLAPYLALVVSGGHSSLIHVRGAGDYVTLGETLDDAVGEAYDKVAKLLGLGYPGGPLLDRLAVNGDPARFDLPRPVLNESHFHFSFSGLKTAVARLVEVRGRESFGEQDLADLAASFQAACIDVLLAKSARALKATGLKRFAIAGGVACNSGLRAAARQRLAGTTLALPEPEFCTDNAAMIAGAGYLAARTRAGRDYGINAEPSLSLR
ncbi:MAG: tRNA N6-adenosine threonylcarbamoyltransferase [Candidatus Sumerlaeota bacterium]|nr:tRNA N6-adenosine threonylcarbamoyltransferase [Candidatus Sumerlaeota bacterium]